MVPTIKALALLSFFGSTLTSAMEFHKRQASQQLFNGSYCSYKGFQANVVGSKLLLFGGNLTIQSRTPSGKMKRAVQKEFQFFSILLNETFRTTGTPATYVRREPDPAAKKNVANIVDGTAFTYQDSLYFYGGQQTFNAAPEDSIFMCTPTTQGNESKIVWDNSGLNNDVTRRITRGSGLMADTEDKGFYFGGQSFGAPTDGADGTPVSPQAGQLGNLVVSRFTPQGQEWKNITTTNKAVKPYTDGNLMFIPQGKEGCLAAIGGQNQGADGAWKSILLFDIATSTWYEQPTTGDLSSGSSKNPGPNTCAVVRSAPDNSTHFVYVYGGESRSQGQSQLAILSLPAFHWTVVEDSSFAPRRGAQCRLVGEDKRQMLIVGGDNGDDSDCNDGEGFVLLLDLSTLSFGTTFPNNNGFSLPDAIKNLTKATAPLAAGGWASNDLDNAYNVQYKPLAMRESESGGTDKGPIIGGVVGGIGGALIIAATAIYLFRNKRKPIVVDNSKTAGANEPFLNQYAQPQPSPGFPQQSPGFPQQSSGFPQQALGFPQQAPGFPQQSPGFPPGYVSPAFAPGGFGAHPQQQDYKPAPHPAHLSAELPSNQRYSQPLSTHQRYSQPVSELGGDSAVQHHQPPVELDSGNVRR